jgi:hypothetical protein
VSQPFILSGERSGLPTHIGTTDSVSLYERMQSSLRLWKRRPAAVVELELKSGMIALAATVREQIAQIQKVSAWVKASKPAPQVVNNP